MAKAAAWKCPEVGIPLEIGKGRIIRQGSKIALLSFGTRLAECEKAADELAALGLSTTIADARFMKPLDEELVLKLAREHEILITIEEGSIGGFGSHVMQYLSDNGALDGSVRMRSMILRTCSSITTRRMRCMPAPVSTPRVSSPRCSRRSARTSRPRR